MKTVLLSGHLPWWDQWQTPHYVARLLAGNASVVYIEPRVAWTRDDAAFSWKRHLAPLSNPMRQVQKNLWRYTPWALPLGRFSRVASWNARLFSRGLEEELVRLSVSQPILWLAETQNAPCLVKMFPQAPRVYHAIDHLVHEGDARVGRELARTADLVLASSPLIAKFLEGTNPRIRIFRNGWDFPPETLRAGPVPKDVASIPSPRVGVVGFVSKNLDYALLLELVRTLPISLVLVGRTIAQLSTDDRRRLESLRKTPRVYLLGEKPVAALPRYLQAFDVCIAPYKMTPRIYASDPLKVYQYLALGKPVVATPVAVLEPLDPLVRIGRTHPEFIELLRRELAAPIDEGSQQSRRTFACGSRWENRWKELQEFLAGDEKLAVLVS